MKYYGTKNNKDYGFYLENFENAIEISDEYWRELLNKQAEEGKIIIPFEDNAVAVNSDEYILENNQWRKLSSEEIENRKKELQDKMRINEILSQLEQLDQRRIRAIAEPSMKDEETSWLEYYNRQIIELRNELNLLQ